MYDSVLSVRANLKEQLRICDVFLVDAANYLELAEDAADRWATFAATTPRATGRIRPAANAAGNASSRTTIHPAHVGQVRDTT
jgi:hypothetical protein